MSNKGVSRRLRRVRRVVGWCIGGFLPEPLSVRSTLATAIIAAIVLVGFGNTLPGFIVGLILAAAVWYMDMTEALTSKASALAMHSRLSISYISWLCIAFAGLYANPSGHLVWLEWVCMGVLAISGWLISAQPGFLDVKPLAGTANLKHNPQRHRPPQIQVTQLLRIVWAAVGVAGVLAAIAIPLTPWATLAVTAATTAIVVWAVGSAWLYAEHARWGVIREMTKIRPTFMMPWESNMPYQVIMWEQYLKQLGEPYLIITRRSSTIEALGQSTTAPIVCPAEPSQAEANALTPSSVQAIFCVYNGDFNDLFFKPGISSVWLHHGDGDKADSARKRSGRYDYLFVAGEAAIDRYKKRNINISDQQFCIIGRPQTSAINVDHISIANKDTPKVLYAPTHQGRNEKNNYSSLAAGPKIVSALIRRGVIVLFRPHPASLKSASHRVYVDKIKDLLNQDHQKSGTPHVWGEKAEGEMRLVENINASDAMIADVSGVVTDYMQSGKPFSMVSTQMPAEQFRQEFPTSRSAYVIDESPGSIDAALEAMLRNDPLAEYRWQRRSYYLGGFEGRESVDRFIQVSRRLIRPAESQPTERQGEPA
jgi:hypothetical protein